MAKNNKDYTTVFQLYEHYLKTDGELNSYLAIVLSLLEDRHYPSENALNAVHDLLQLAKKKRNSAQKELSQFFKAFLEENCDV